MMHPTASSQDAVAKLFNHAADESKHATLDLASSTAACNASLATSA